MTGDAISKHAMAGHPVHITMVKKRLASGDACDKCVQAEQLLRGRGLWHRIDEVMWADERDPDSDGMRLSARYGVRLAPFFVVTNGAAEPSIYKSTLRLMRECMPGGSPRPPAPPSDGELAEAAATLANGTPQDALTWVLRRHGRDCALAFSGAEDVVLIDMAVRTGLDFSVLCLDTGRLHPETYAFVERVRKHYGVEIELMSPDASKLQVFVRKKGLFSFLEDGHKECCGIRKVEPLRRALSRYGAWVTGQRRDQSPATRAEVPILQEDDAFEGRGGGKLVKCNPLSAWTADQTWAYIRSHDVPYNALHEQGFRSIGCQPCTRPVHPGQHEREGRWWWEAETQKECGLHSGD
ncbi:MAG: phosphoadenylyl-sulfate reductase [Myxococcales bacterium]|nr:phosphoadenylyl-sulfate reductase [Myxococcales bacterium]